MFQGRGFSIFRISNDFFRKEMMEDPMFPRLSFQ